MKGFVLALCAAFASGALPPWWILNGIKPAGEPQNMGSYSMITFSQAQQEHFSIDEHGEPTDSEKFQKALKALKASKERSEESTSEERRHKYFLV
mmetsp:Transcript_136042/g.322378  ORF Transcript_136042/g.322378 Transcript_136042/m.322378 type:complete len:95 (+) Transcript_136042:40-324(+)